MFYSIQIGRGLASLFVVLFHLGGTIALEKYFNVNVFDSIFSFGFIGVEFFFVLSGFIIYYIHNDDFSKPEKLKIYIKKRFIRVYPIYWIIFICIFIGIYFIPSLRTDLPIDVFIKSLLLLPQDKEIVGGTGAPVLIVAWSLQYEITFYLLFALLIINRKFIYPMVIFYVYIYFNSNEHFFYKFLTKDIFLLFLMGIVVASLVKNKLSNKLSISIVSFSLILLIITITLKQFGIIILEKENIIFGLIFSLLILGIVNMEQNGFDFKKYKFLNLLGDISYSMYLLHFPLISFIIKILIFVGLDKTSFTDSLICFILILIIVIAISVVFHKMIEKPLTIYLSRKFK